MKILPCRFKKVSYTVEAVVPADSSSITGQQHVQQLQSVESELLRTREEMAVFEKTYREVTMVFPMILSSKGRGCISLCISAVRWGRLTGEANLTSHVSYPSAL